MKIKKILDYFHLMGSILFVIGIVVTVVLLLNKNKTTDINVPNLWLLYLPNLIFSIISICLIFVYFWNKNNYFKLIKMHTNIKWLWYSYASALVVAVGITVTLILFWLANFISQEDQTKWYFYLVIAIAIFFMLISSGLESYSKFRISIDIARRRYGEELEKEKNAPENDGKDLSDSKNLNNDSTIVFDNKLVENDSEKTIDSKK